MDKFSNIPGLEIRGIYDCPQKKQYIIPTDVMPFSTESKGFTFDRWQVSDENPFTSKIRKSTFITRLAIDLKLFDQINSKRIADVSELRILDIRLSEEERCNSLLWLKDFDSSHLDAIMIDGICLDDGQYKYTIPSVMNCLRKNVDTSFGEAEQNLFELRDDLFIGFSWFNVTEDSVRQFGYDKSMKHSFLGNLSFFQCKMHGNIFKALFECKCGGIIFGHTIQEDPQNRLWRKAYECAVDTLPETDSCLLSNNAGFGMSSEEYNHLKNMIRLRKDCDIYEIRQFEADD